MNRVEKTYKRILLLAGILAFSWLFYGSVRYLFNLANVEEATSSLLGFAGVFVLIQLVILVLFLFRLIDKISMEKQNYITIAVLVGMSFLLVLCLCSFHPAQGTDAFDDLDTAMYIAKNGPVGMDVLHGCIKVFGNNYLMILMFAGCFRFMSMIGFTGNVLIPLYVLDSVLIVFSAWISYATVKQVSGKKNANKVLLLLALNPLFYFYVFWVYSPILCVPIMIGILYLLVRLVKAQSKRSAAVIGAGIGILAILAYEIRVVALFPLLAAMVIMVFVLKRRSEIRGRILVGSAALLLAAVISFFALSALIKPYFEEVKSENMPVWFWLSLGSHDNGTAETSDFDMRVAAKAETPEQRSELLKKQAFENYRTLGFYGTVKLWLRKALNNWCDGTGGIAFRISIGEIDSDAFELFGASQNIPFRMYCQVYRVLLYLGMLAFCVRYLTGRKMEDFSVLLLTTILGGILFYFIWEVKSEYSFPFLALMGMIAALGLTGREEGESQVTVSNKELIHRGFIGAYIGWTVLSVLIFGMLFSWKHWVEYRRIYTTIDGRVSIYLDGAQNIKQDFYTEKPINRLVFLTGSTTGQDCSTYDITVRNSKGTVMASQKVSSQNISGGNLGITFKEAISGDSHYTIEIIKNQPEKADIRFVAKKVYYLDNYRGDLIVDGNSDYTGDLKMNASFLIERRYFGKTLSVILLGLYLGLSGALLWGFERSFRWTSQKTAEN